MKTFELSDTIYCRQILERTWRNISWICTRIKISFSSSVNSVGVPFFKLPFIFWYIQLRERPKYSSEISPQDRNIKMSSIFDFIFSIFYLIPPPLREGDFVFNLLLKEVRSTLAECTSLILSCLVGRTFCNFWLLQSVPTLCQLVRVSYCLSLIDNTNLVIFLLLCKYLSNYFKKSAIFFLIIV